MPQKETLAQIVKELELHSETVLFLDPDLAGKMPPRAQLFELLAPIDDHEAELLLPGVRALMTGLPGQKMELEPHQERGQSPKKADRG